MLRLICLYLYANFPGELAYKPVLMVLNLIIRIYFE